MPVKKVVTVSKDGKKKTSYHAYINTVHNGKRKQIYLDGIGHPKYSEALAVCERIKNPHQAIDEKRLTIINAHNIFRETLERDVGLFIRPKTLEQFDYLFKHFLHLFKHRQLQSIIYDDIEQFKYHLLKLGLSKRTANIGLTQLKKFFSFCTRKRWITHRPDIVLIPQTYNLKKVEWLEEDHVARLMEYSNPQQFIYINLMVWTGMRPFECHNLNWDSVDLENKEITIFSDMNKDNKRGRVIPIHSRLQDVMINLDRSSARLSPWEHEKTAYTQLTRLSNITGVRVNPYMLRKTFGSLMVKNGVPIEVLSKLMGSSVATLMKHYVGLLESHKRESIERITIPQFQMK